MSVFNVATHPESGRALIYDIPGRRWYEDGSGCYFSGGVDFDSPYLWGSDGTRKPLLWFRHKTPPPPGPERVHVKGRLSDGREVNGYLTIEE